MNQEIDEWLRPFKPKSDAKATRELWDKRAEEVSGFKVGKVDRDLEILERKMDFSESSVLDVGFGAGRYLVEFLKRGAEIAGIEISPEMRAYALTALNEVQKDYDAQQLIVSALEDLPVGNWQHRFDLVFNHFGPRIYTSALLDKMLDFSKKGLFVAAYCFREDRLLTELQEYFNYPKKAPGEDSFGYLPALAQALYKKGYFAELHYVKNGKDLHFDTQRILPRYVGWLFDDEPNPELLHKLETEFERRSQNGKITTYNTEIVGYLYVDKQINRGITT